MHIVKYSTTQVSALVPIVIEIRHRLAALWSPLPFIGKMCVCVII